MRPSAYTCALSSEDRAGLRNSFTLLDTGSLLATMDLNLSPGTRSKLTTLRRQYFQLVDPAQLIWPDEESLKAVDAQSWMFNNLFDVDNISYPPPEQYQLRVLKLLISKLERAFVDPEKDV